eukprot:COSAG01_NODE_1696_length_9461_cov_8.289010_5_plen_85_part_00
MSDAAHLTDICLCHVMSYSCQEPQPLTAAACARPAVVDWSACECMLAQKKKKSLHGSRQQLHGRAAPRTYASRVPACVTCATAR